MKSVLLFLCFFILAAMTWLCIMEIILNPSGSGLRICLTFLLASQSLSKILFLIFRGHGRFQAEVYRWILRITRDSSAAEDVFVKAFRRAYRGRAQFNPLRSFGAWMRRMATNEALD